jgi:serine/threonine protein kinase
METNNSQHNNTLPSEISTLNGDTISSSYSDIYGLLNDAQILDNDIGETVKCCIENIGKGVFGTVTKGIDMNTGKAIIIKTMIIKNPTIVAQDTSLQHSTLQQSYQQITHDQMNTAGTTRGSPIASALGTTTKSFEGTDEIAATQTTSTLISLTADDKNKIEKIIKEMDVMKKLTNQNIIKYVGHKSDKSNSGYVIMIYMEDICGKSLDVLYKLPLTDKFINTIAYQIFSGLEYMHSQNVVHKDIKQKNILLGNDGIVKIIDFGESVVLLTDQITHVTAGTPLYMSPEVLKPILISKIDGFKCDIWAAIIIIVELYIKMEIKIKYDNTISLIFGVSANKYIILHECLNALLCMLKNNQYVPINLSIASDINDHIIPIIKEIFSITTNHHILLLIDLLCLCLEPDVTKRYTASEVLFHPFITDEVGVYKSDIVKNVLRMT